MTYHSVCMKTYRWFYNSVSNLDHSALLSTLYPNSFYFTELIFAYNDVKYLFLCLLSLPGHKSGRGIVVWGKKKKNIVICFWNNL